MLMTMHFLLICLAIGAPIRSQALPPIGPFEAEMALPAAITEPDDADEGDEADDGESELAEPTGAVGPDIRYSADLSDDELQRRWTDDLESLGSISVGFADQGRLINAARMPQDDAWILERPTLAYGTHEAVEALINAFRAVRKQFPESAPVKPSGRSCQSVCPVSDRKSTHRYAASPRSPIPYGPGSEVGCRSTPLVRGKCMSLRSRRSGVQAFGTGKVKDEPVFLGPERPNA